MLPLPARKSEFYRDVFQVIAEVGCTVVAPRVYLGGKSGQPACGGPQLWPILYLRPGFAAQWLRDLSSSGHLNPDPPPSRPVCHSGLTHD